MSSKRSCVGLGAILLVVFANATAARFSIGIGVPFPIYSPRPVIVQPASPVYIEKSENLTPPGETLGNWWHYCSQSDSYYPYIKECPAGWRQVSPQPNNR